MDVIDGKWIEARLSVTHGARKALADAVRLTPDKITKIIKGERTVKANEIPLIMRYFHSQALAPGGLHEAAAHYAVGPVAVITKTDDAIGRLAGLAAPLVKAPVTFTMQRSAFAAGLLAGDVLIAELGNTATAGDLVLVTLNDTMHDIQTTVLRRFLPPLLVALELGDLPISLSAIPALESAVLATIKAIVRAPQLQQNTSA